MSYTFKSVVLFKQQTLGTGAYGAVCKAKCDDLLCAAKLIYPVLLDLSDQPAPTKGKEHRIPFQRFEKECEFLSQVRHPNVVQYLGTYRDPDSGAPALLMEMMDESLTHFLQKQQTPLSLHIEVNLLHDVALALAYLHSNTIVHRDLSSNNVLLIGSSRAKITDFGMSSLVDMAPSRMATLTTCPGTQVYMPPEALNEQPVYSENLDCFSFGVMMVQVLTRQFPDPSSRFHSIEACQPGNSSIKFQAQVLVPEIKRRRNHIDKVKNHPLLPIALACLNDSSIKRPKASELCQRLATFKDRDPSYSKSLVECQDLQKCLSTQQQLHHKKRELEEMVSTKDDEIEQLNARLQKLEVDNMQLAKEHHMIKLKLLLKKELTNETLSNGDTSALMLDSIKWTKCQSTPIKMDGGTATQDANMAYFAPQGSQIVYQFDPNAQEWTKLPPCPNSNVAVVMVDSLLTVVGGYNFKSGISDKLHSYVMGKWVEELPQMSTKRFAVTAVSNKHVLIVAGGFGHGDKRLPTVEMMDIHVRQWHSVTPLTFGITEASAVIVNGRVYVGGGYSHIMDERRVMASSLDGLLSPDSEWEFITNLPVNHTTLSTTLAGGRLLAFGGDTSNQIYSYNDKNNTWEVVSSFLEARANPLVATLPNLLIIVGGNGCNRAVELGTSTDLTANCSVM